MGLLFTQSLFAQRGGRSGPPKSANLKIVGKVIHAETTQQMEYVTLLLLQAKDSSQVAGTVSNAKGSFELSAGAGEYILKASFIGFETVYIPNVVLTEDRPFQKIPVIQLAVKTTTLDEIDIVVEKSSMEFALDKKIFNVGKDLANLGGSASDLLDNIPSVSVDIDGNVSLRGNEGVRILVNGKPSSLAGPDALKQLSADMIEKVEIITNPSARYEAEGSAGILNIILKKDRRKGWNGSFNGTYGIPDAHNLSVNLNHRREKVNFFGSVGGRYRNTPRYRLERRQLFDEFGELSSQLNQDQNSFRGGYSGNLRLGMDYYLSPNTILTGSIVLRKGDGFNSSTIDYTRFDNTSSLIGSTLRLNEEDEVDESIDYNFTFEHSFARDGQKLSVDFVFEDELEAEYMEASQEDFDPFGEVVPQTILEQLIGNEEDQRNGALRIDYEHPFKKDGKIEIGYRGSIREIGNDYQIEEFDNESQSWELLENLSNDFFYDEKIHAFYGTVGDKLGKFSYQGGLRYEHTGILTLLRDTNEENTKTYGNFFPSAFLSYEIGTGNNIQISYSRRLRRPRFRSLNPFFNFSNPLSIRTGNPDLDPEFADSYEIGNIKYWKKSTLSSSIYYRRSEGVISRISTLTEDGINITQPENLNSRDDWGVELSWTYTPAKWVDITWNANAFYGKLNGENLGFDDENTFISYSSRLNTRFSLKKDINIQLMINYRGPQGTAQGERKGILFTDLGINKDVLDKKATVSFRVSDVFNTMFYRSEAFGEDFYIYSEGRWRARQQMYITFNYRLNQKKDRRRSRRDGNDGGDFEEGF
ncbi:MAG: outer membrane beta-barrel family protein [Bacteroidota bacterium]